MMQKGASRIHLGCGAAAAVGVNQVGSSDELLLDSAKEDQERKGQIVDAEFGLAAPAKQDACCEVGSAHHCLIRNRQAAALQQRAGCQFPRMASRGGDGGSAGGEEGHGSTRQFVIFGSDLGWLV